MLTAILAGLGKVAAVAGKVAAGAGKAAAGAAQGIAQGVGQAATSVGQTVAQVAPQIGANIQAGGQIAAEGITKGGAQVAQGFEGVANALPGAAQGAQAAPGAAGMIQPGLTPRAVNAPAISYQQPNIVSPSASSMRPQGIVNMGYGTGGRGGVREYLGQFFGQGGGNSGPGAAQPSQGGGFGQGGMNEMIGKLMKGDMSGLMGGGGGGGMGGMGMKIVPEGPTNDAPPVEWGQIQPFTPYARPMPSGPMSRRAMIAKRLAAGPYSRGY